MDTTLQTTKLNSFRANWKKSSLQFPAEITAKAEENLTTLDFPTTRVERWKYTRVTKISNKEFTLASELPTISSLPELPINDAYNFVFVDGLFDAHLSSKDIPESFEFQPIENAVEAKEKLGSTVNLDQKVFAALNTVYTTSGAYIHVKAKQVVDKTIQLVFISTGEHKAANLRNLIVVDQSAEARISKVSLSENATECFTNIVTEIILGDDAHLTVDNIQNESESNYQISQDFASQPADCTLSINTITLEGALVRNNIFIDVTGENAMTHLNGAYVLKNKQHVDNHTFIKHIAPHCESHELYRGVLDDNSVGVFNGMIYVSQHAQKIDSYQSNGNVLLSDSASVNSKPELEIYADDVKCSHGSTTGQLDEQAIFYLRARGISKKSARALLVTAFIGDALNKFHSDEIVEYAHNVLEKRFGWTF